MKALTIADAERAVKRIRACDGETAAIAILGQWSREQFTEALMAAADMALLVCPGPCACGRAIAAAIKEMSPVEDREAGGITWRGKE